MRVRSIGIAMVVLAFVDASLCHGQALARSARIVAENDSFDFWIPPDKRSDDNYTQGARVSWDPIGVPGFARRLLCRQRTDCGSSFEIGQEMYTPTKDSSIPLPGERSFAGWLYVRGDVVAATSTLRRDVALIVGVTGPASLAEFAQERIHRTFWPYRLPLGWKYQLPTEPDMALQFTQDWRLAPPGAGARWADFLPTAHATVGTLRTAVGAGARLRAGYDLDHPWLADAAPHAFSAFVFVGATGEAVARDLFLDGDTFRPSLHRDHKPLVGNWERGAGVRLASVGLEYRAVTQSKEYQAGPATHTVGGITLTWWIAR
jgi:lipid A 3-O-deacylase